MGSASCSAHLDFGQLEGFVPHIVPRTLVSVPQSVPECLWDATKYWSEWQDLNLRPLVPNGVALSMTGKAVA
jgi:hypothetical protein